MTNFSGDRPDHMAAGAENPRQLFVYSGGFLTQRRTRRILELAGYQVRIGQPKQGDFIGVWGQSPTSDRGQTRAKNRGLPLVIIEDSFLRSLHPGRLGEPPTGLSIDHKGVHFDASVPSDLETLLETHPLDDTYLLQRARTVITRLKEEHLTKYIGFDRQILPPDPGYVLVIDQTRDDASVRANRADRNRFREMLYVAQAENPGAKILIKTHPETAKGKRPGYFEAEDLSDRVAFYSDPISPWTLCEGAIGVYTVSSQFGFEAILAGHKPRVFGQPFYAGWGLTQDEFPIARRQRRLTRAQLTAAALILYPTWYDPFRDRLCEIETVIDNLSALARAWREDHRGWTADGMRLWKRPHLQKFFGREQPVVFSNTTAHTYPHRRHMVWASQGNARDDHVRVEDGFLRSNGLGAKLVPPVSLVLDDQGIYYDPSRPSRLEEWIEKRATLRPDQTQRAEKLIRALIASGITKYTTGQKMPPLPEGQKILVVGQVEDDASMRCGAGTIRTNQALLETARTARPDATLIYKPHPDVEAGLRQGKCDATMLADQVVENASPASLLDQVDELWTMTSLMGFEALLRRVPVITLGAPFYAGWDLTQDLGSPPERRVVRPSLEGLVHAALIDYPRYLDPLTGAPCPVEVIVERLASGNQWTPGLASRFLFRVQGLFASRTRL